MRLLHIFLLNFQQVLEQRARAFVWFIVSLFNPLVFLLYWHGALKTTSLANWSLANISSYYFLMVVAGSLLTSHVEDDVATIDIMEGNLAAHLLRPFPYFWISFFREIPMRLLQGSIGFVTILLFLLFFGNLFIITHSAVTFLLSLLIAVLAYFLSFICKMILGITAFWVTDIEGLFQITDMVIWIFAGYVMPLALLPTTLQQIAYALPFSYMLYFPITALQGKFHTGQLFQIILIQTIWITIFSLCYIYLWRKGVRKFTAIGQ